MSADNWAMCPQCKKIADRNRAEIAKKAEDSYGKIPAAEYLELLAATKEPDSSEVDLTLREDYEIGVLPDGEFYVRYSASCKCGFVFNYKYETDVPLSDKPAETPKKGKSK